MATHLDLEEQEQLDQLKAFWKQYGNLISWIVIAAVAAYAAWSGWNYWQRDQAVKAGAMYDELSRAAQAGDAERASRVFEDLKSRYPGTVFTQQAALMAAQAQADKGQPDAARATLTWVADNAAEPEYRTIARLRLAGLLLDEKKYDEALRVLDEAKAPNFAGLVADRRGDVFRAQGKDNSARSSYLAAWQAIDERVAYRRLVEAKLGALGVTPPAAAASGASK
ncbi:YfgM family protein [Piscinibacter koreensis]|uniref:Ancillary SecYEG translocon subunit n=1 Tax=Piscinibacter koreensis TaxID=2742824 RepID=A0A7Y6NN88_9BURK|nr:tetratricopeptide repeat protein [Schlegelella koreensis]NUZ06194.1 tetratricopeptide repeat protein [Schlegelella koreensis]